MPKRLSLSQVKTELIFPGSLTKYTVDVLGYLYEETSILTTRSGSRVGLVFGPAVVPSQNGLASISKPLYLLFFYGNGMSLATSSEVLAYFQLLGLNVLIAEYEGYGMSSGHASEEGCYASADAAYFYLTETLQVKPAQILVGGWSLGAAVAIDLACRQPVAGLLAFSPFTTLVEEAKVLLPWVPQPLIQWLMQERFDNLRKIRQITCPILLAHGTRDSLVPFKMADKLAQEARASRSVTLLPLYKYNHHDLFEPEKADLQHGIEDFLFQVRHEVEPH
jgi:fermentation-respiration switch protein FrsA (DUF1100 family)